MQQRQIILASGSPRRKELMTLMGVDFKVIPSDFDEQLDDARTPEEVAKELGLGKAMTVARQYPDAIVIGSDSIVTIDGKQLAKPADIDEAREFLKILAGRCNIISCSLAVVCLAEQFQTVDVANADVYFKSYNTEAAEKYLKTGDWADKAGGYGVQNGADVFIDYIDGDYDTVLGLPTTMLATVLKQFGYDVTAAKPSPPKGLRFKEVQSV
jgi:septum formation protein